MVQRRSPKRDRQLIAIGANITRWRKLQGLSASALADRAYVTRATLRGIEQGTGTASFHAVLAVFNALGIADPFVTATDPMESPAGRALIDEQIAGV
ncbi:helix-turn-helix domain-containing protein [Leucobacter celer]|uniref:helix-turn-helix domain-containing protein n=1 Tax=Leucobacter celer TaxID=668625 RepID=UPI0009495FA8|nr:helix-turn-helix transcriptional regulator [Leucobacter celer]